MTPTSKNVSRMEFEAWPQPDSTRRRLPGLSPLGPLWQFAGALCSDSFGSAAASNDSVASAWFSVAVMHCTERTVSRPQACAPAPPPTHPCVPSILTLRTLLLVCLLHRVGKPGTKRDVDGNEVPQKRSKAAAAAGGDAMDVSLPSASLSAPARPGERVWHSDEHTVFVKGMGFQVMGKAVVQEGLEWR